MGRVQYEYCTAQQISGHAHNFFGEQHEHRTGLASYMTIEKRKTKKQKKQKSKEES